MQIWKSANIFVLIWKQCVEDFTLMLLTGRKHCQKKTTALMKSMIIDIWVVGTSNPLFVMRGF